MPGRIRPALRGAGDDPPQADGLVNFEGVGTNEAIKNLVQLFPGQINKAGKEALRQLLEKGDRGKLFTDPKFQNEVFALINKITKAKDAPTREANQEKVLAALLTGGGMLDIFGIWGVVDELMKAGRLTNMDLTKIFEGRHLSKYKALLDQMPFIKQLYAALKDLNDEFSEAGNKLFRESDQGRWEAAVAAMDRAFARLRASEGVRGLINTFERIAGFIADLPPRFVEFGGKAMAASVGLAAFGVAANGIAKAFEIIGRSPVLKVLAGGAGLAALFGGIDAFMGFDRLDAKDLPLPQFLGENAPIWQTVERLRGLFAEVSRLFDGIGNLTADFQKFLGLDPSQSPILKGLQLLNGLIERMTADVRYLNDVGFLGFLAGKRSGKLEDWGLAGWLADAIRKWFQEQQQPQKQSDRMIRGIDPAAGLGTVQVQGQAQVEIENRVRIEIDGPGRVTDQSGGRGVAEVPLDTGRSMEDTGPRRPMGPR